MSSGLIASTQHKRSPLPNETRAYVSSSFLQGFSGLVIEKGGDTRKLLAQAGLSPETLTGRPCLIQFEAFISLIEYASTTLDIPALPFLLLHRQSVDILGPLSKLLGDAQSVREVFYRIAEHLSLVVSGIHLQVVETDTCVELIYKTKLPLLEERPVFQYYLLGATFLVLTSALPIERRIRSVHLKTQQPVDSLTNAILRFFKCPVKFSAETLKINFSKDVFESVVSPDLKSYPGNWIGNQSLSNYIEGLIGLLLPSKIVSIDTVADILGMSQSTLHRHLALEKTSFKKLLLSVRIQLADDYLKNTPYSLQDIALLLGYSNQSAFSRSYLRCTGCLPSVTRQAARPIPSIRPVKAVLRTQTGNSLQTAAHPDWP